MSESAENLNLLLREIELELQQIDLWTAVKPEKSCLTSDIPFCYDRLPFAHWIQWVMIPRFDAILRKGDRLPEFSEIAPMAELAFSEIEAKTNHLLKLIQQLDELLNRQTTKH